MNLLKEWMDACEYRITEGSEYQWACYGPEAYCLDSWNGRQDGHSFTVIFDKQDQTVYELQAHDYVNNRAYRWINPDYKLEFDAESVDRGVDAEEAWDDLKYVLLETTEDFFDKMTAIYEGEDYDTRVQVPLTLDDDQMFELMKMAHAEDITLNQLVERLLRRTILEQTQGEDLG
jgi:hypothetical protein